MRLDRSTRRSGSASAFLRGMAPTAGGFGTLMQSIDGAERCERLLGLAASTRESDAASKRPALPLGTVGSFR